MTTERSPRDQYLLSILSATEPVITAHLAELNMDTEADNELLATIRQQWNRVVRPLVNAQAPEGDDHVTELLQEVADEFRATFDGVS